MNKNIRKKEKKRKNIEVGGKLRLEKDEQRNNKKEC
jgi:hypothetical protein